jgi:hypothetical protein
MHEVIQIVRQCEDCRSAIFGWRSVCSHLMCWKIQQLRRYPLRMASTSAEARRSISSKVSPGV